MVAGENSLCKSKKKKIIFTIFIIIFFPPKILSFCQSREVIVVWTKESLKYIFWNSFYADLDQHN